ncbi:mediator of RNA polymerase II transcription subunit 22 isoform X1 [Grus americana]|uniref:mediator of RNA polymerase II transcription subunit 22 isoform X1 n=1 Tax=Grus americana TaxID=9117 RepID=UPI002407DB98|nr:mediator of RNA polymerase II transcription subunit 22 isoform X1 [Grus americana]XP_054705219.1 mediator of RNA polymerase II transcription subunit 22 isoform X1 [Grus americana]
MAQQRVLPQSKETLLQSYNKRLKDDVKSIMDNFTEIIKTAKIEDETQVSRATQGEQDNYEMHVRAANIVRAGESLMKLVSDLKQFLILNDFPSVNEAINQRNQQLRSLQEECDKKLIALRDEISIDLYELEEEYYSSSCHSRAERCSLAELNPIAPSCERAWGRPHGALLKRILCCRTCSSWWHCTAGSLPPAVLNKRLPLSGEGTGAVFAGFCSLGGHGAFSIPETLP